MYTISLCLSLSLYIYIYIYIFSSGRCREAEHLDLQMFHEFVLQSVSGTGMETQMSQPTYPTRRNASRSRAQPHHTAPPGSLLSPSCLPPVCLLAPSCLPPVSLLSPSCLPPRSPSDLPGAILARKRRALGLRGCSPPWPRWGKASTEAEESRVMSYRVIVIIIITILIIIIIIIMIVISIDIIIIIIIMIVIIIIIIIIIVIIIIVIIAEQSRDPKWHRWLSWRKGRLSDAGGLGFESQTGRVTGRCISSLRGDEHPAIKGLLPPEHHARHSIRTKQDSSESKTTAKQAPERRPSASNQS